MTNWLESITDPKCEDVASETSYMYLELLLWALHTNRINVFPFNHSPPVDHGDINDSYKFALEIIQIQPQENKSEGCNEVKSVVADNLKEYFAVQDLSDFGTHCFFAFSDSAPLPDWNIPRILKKCGNPDLEKDSEYWMQILSRQAECNRENQPISETIEEDKQEGGESEEKTEEGTKENEDSICPDLSKIESILQNLSFGGKKPQDISSFVERNSECDKMRSSTISPRRRNTTFQFDSNVLCESKNAKIKPCGQLDGGNTPFKFESDGSKNSKMTSRDRLDKGKAIFQFDSNILCDDKKSKVKSRSPSYRKNEPFQFDPKASCNSNNYKWTSRNQLNRGNTVQFGTKDNLNVHNSMNSRNVNRIGTFQLDTNFARHTNKSRDAMRSRNADDSSNELSGVSDCFSDYYTPDKTEDINFEALDPVKYQLMLKERNRKFWEGYDINPYELTDDSIGVCYGPSFNFNRTSPGSVNRGEVDNKMWERSSFMGKNQYPRYHSTPMELPGNRNVPKYSKGYKLATPSLNNKNTQCRRPQWTFNDSYEDSSRASDKAFRNYLYARTRKYQNQSDRMNDSRQHSLPRNSRILPSSEPRHTRGKRGHERDNQASNCEMSSHHKKPLETFEQPERRLQFSDIPITSKQHGPNVSRTLPLKSCLRKSQEEASSNFPAFGIHRSPRLSFAPYKPYHYFNDKSFASE